MASLVDEIKIGDFFFGATGGGLWHDAWDRSNSKYASSRIKHNMCDMSTIFS